jgi:uncharacterized protein YjlB
MRERRFSAEFRGVVRPARLRRIPLYDRGNFPNSRFPLLVYRGALLLPAYDPASLIERLFKTHRWNGTWRDGIYNYQHYHSTAHEVLGIFGGSAKVQFGGPEGIIETLGAGDVVLIPAGVAHKNTGSTNDFAVVGAYPAGQHWDMCYGKEGERPRTDEQIGRVPMPVCDPVYGLDGPLHEYWKT